MTTLDQIRLLETKVENAVAKMQQLQAENDALRNKCAELTNALESKTEQLLAFTTNKEEIEEGIKNALDRLNYIENSVLSTSSNSSSGQGSIHITPGAGLSSIEPIIEDTNSNEETVLNNSFSSKDSVSDSSNLSENTENTTNFQTPSYPENNDTVDSEVVKNVEYNSQPASNQDSTVINKSFNKENVAPSFNTMEMVQQQPENVIPENTANKNDADDGDQDAFEYDIF